ncbi:TetR/AcrR family transcriptional regulator [Brucepastera parasyntrophica]|uniref:TetR/AcrR family transcriptional regulator n=1 Tax=Brucepastera parasyntrophica TaxID=2880008 RepID=UPI00210A41BB|nr:TetR/AcrR family transcriptional regulator [Brucepastera parasyntrophica]ULQ60311.1 TetR/AcrR family transcriptional regulator [Brucepastera parasyntrophica]
MERRNTKQLILDEALELFSVSGYDGVTVKDIADAVGIKDSSLYKHFKSKQEIYDSLLEEMDARFAETVSMYRLPQGEIKRVAAEYGRNDLVWLKQACEAIFLFFLKDPKASRFRKMLMIEQYKNSNAAKTFQNWFIDSAMHFQTELFSEMIAQGFFRKGPADIIALQFYAPFYLILCQYDTMPEKEGDAVMLLMRHIEQFAIVYQIRNGVVK